MTACPYTTRPISHAEAPAVARRLIADSFHRDGERHDYDLGPRFSIPTRPDHDDDCLMLAYLKQQQRAESERADRALTDLARLDREAGLLDLDPAVVDRAIAEDSVGAQRVDERAVANAIWLAIRDDEDRGDMELDDIPRDHLAWKAARAVVSLIARSTS